MTKGEALKLALVALDMMVTPRSFQAQVRIKEIYDSIREALAQPEQEPVAYVAGYFSGRVVVEPVNRALVMNTGTALYTTPPQREWQGLTDEEIYPLYSEPSSDAEMVEFARAIEAKLKEKNT